MYERGRVVGTEVQWTGVWDYVFKPSSGKSKLLVIRRSDRSIAVAFCVPSRGLRRPSFNRLRRLAMQFVRRCEDASNGLPNIRMLDDEHFRQSFPALSEYLTLDYWDDGTQRRTSTLLVFCEEGVWKGCLNDRENERSCWATAETHDELLKALNERLANGTSEWRRSDRPAARKSGKSPR